MSARQLPAVLHGNLMLSVLGAFAEFERAWLKERQREGIALARQRGAYRGRKPALSPEKAAELSRRAQAGEKKACLAHEFGISRETLYQYLRQEPGDVAPDGSPPPDGRKLPGDVMASLFQAVLPNEGCKIA